MNVKGFNITVKQDGKELVITNTLANGITFLQKAGTNFTYDTDLTLNAEITISDEDFIKLVDVLVNAQQKVKEQLKKPKNKTVITVEDENTTKTKAEPKQPKKAKKGGKR